MNRFRAKQEKLMRIARMDCGNELRLLLEGLRERKPLPVTFLYD